MYFPPNTPIESISAGVNSGVKAESKLRPSGSVSSYVYPRCIRSLTVIHLPILELFLHKCLGRLATPACVAMVVVPVTKEYR